MRMQLKAAFLMIAFLGSCAAPHKPAPKAPKRYLSQTNTIRALVYSNAEVYREVDTPEVNRFLVLLGHDHGIEVTVTEHPIDLMTANLKRYDVLILNSTTYVGFSLPEYARADIQQWFEEGHGIVAMHTAEAGSRSWPWLHKLIGTDYLGDSDVVPVTVVVDEKNREHPAVAGWGPRFTITASLHNFDKSVTGLPGFKVLLRADESSYEPLRATYRKGGHSYKGQVSMGNDHPIVWTNTAGNGRMLYTQLGHDVHSIDTDFGHQHLVESIKWAADASIRDRSIPLKRRCDTPCPLYENRTSTPRTVKFYRPNKWRLHPSRTGKTDTETPTPQPEAERTREN